jgi:hypothetical protein
VRLDLARQRDRLLAIEGNVQRSHGMPFSPLLRSRQGPIGIVDFGDRLLT